ncbi:hypothetical protein [Nannocystis pusilla]|uniref:hypothetical protein n=1 Tax=Nannocystis pusilla TaxID=889268 RepID=UPI003DA2A234
MLATIEAAHPDHAPGDNVRPVEDLVKVAEEAGQALEYAPTLALQRLMHYVHTARTVAYQRTGDRWHACALLEDAELLLSSRKDAPELAVREACQSRVEATRICVPSGPTTNASASTPPGAPEPAAREPGPRRAPGGDLRRSARISKDAAGLFAGAGVMTAGTLATAVFAAFSKGVLRDQVRAVQGQGYRLPEDDALLDLSYSNYKLGVGLAISCGVLAAALFSVGAWWVRSDKAGRPNRVSLSPFAGERQAGLSWSGRF